MERDSFVHLLPVTRSPHERFPYTSITGDSFCGYAETEFTTAGILLTPIVLIPTIVIGAPFVIVGGVVYALSFGTINFFS